ncbi:hypothetical protein [Synechococcus sp. PCC 7336]|uniref:hypothetical protein n=1 Tax=Synechococcus sp. PCC 7336 TaxID=195250 RepID=UPI000477F260|nr:hypothetical protein [Synechococcus sp. PCC 7336]
MGDTYNRRSQLGASRRRLEDALALHKSQRWIGSTYLGEYAIECSLKSLICYEERKNSFKETRGFQAGLQGASLHSLQKLLKWSPTLQRTIELDRTGKYKNAWKTITSTWRNDELRYSDKQGNKLESQKFIAAVKKIHLLLLNRQGE